MKIKRIFTAMLSLVMAFSIMTSASAVTFTDVPDEHPYKDAIDYCSAKGYVLGTGGGTFAPDAKLSRAQLATIWCRALHIIDENHTFADISPLTHYYDTPVIVLRSLGILHGASDTTFSVHTDITREQLALIAKRTYDLGVANEDAYQRYTDHAQVSEWARDGISACLNANVFQGLYDGDDFKPQQAVTRAELCKLIFNIDLPKHTVTIDELEGGSITASPTTARAGATINLTITPDEGMRLVAGSLKFDETPITGTAFTMPSHDVLVTAEFEEAPVLESISITSEAADLDYNVGETLNLDGLTVTAHYTTIEDKLVTGFTTDPAEGATLDTAGDVTVTISYTEGGVTKTATFVVVVSEGTR